MKTILGIALALLVLFSAGGQAAAQESAKAKALFIYKQPDHPYASHMYEHTSKMLAACVRLNGFEAVVSEGWPKDAAVLKDVKTIVVYTSPAAEILLDGEHRDEVDRVMKQGVGLVTIHWASTVKKENFERLGERWMSYLGGTWISNVGLSTDTSQLKQLNPKHPICRGWSEYELHDEYYLNPTLGKDAQPLLQVTTKGQDVVVGWAFERPGGGRAYGTTLGHYYRNFTREPFRRAIVNAILWTARMEVPEGGARIDVSEDVLALPPEPAKAAAAAAQKDVADEVVELKKDDRIIFFGDSLTSLAGDEKPKEHVTKGYVRIVRETLQEKHKDKNIEVDWVATGGHTVPDLLKRVDNDVIAKKPTIVVIQIGCNDARRIPAETFKSGLVELIDKLQKADIRVVQCSLTSVGEKHDGTNKDDPKLDEFAQIARGIAKEKKVPLNDLRKAFIDHWKKSNPENKPSGVLTYDGNHFNQKGMDFVAEQMLKKFK